MLLCLPHQAGVSGEGTEPPSPFHAQAGACRAQNKGLASRVLWLFDALDQRSVPF